MDKQGRKHFRALFTALTDLKNGDPALFERAYSVLQAEMQASVPSDSGFWDELRKLAPGMSSDVINPLLDIKRDYAFLNDSEKKPLLEFVFEQ